MNSKTKPLITSVILAIIILAILSIFLGIVIGLIIAVLVGLATFWLFSSKNDDKSNSENENSELSVTEVANQALLMANLDLRKSIISPELRTNYESLIDLLIELLPLVNGTKDAPDTESELGWVINRMATEYLPNKSIAPYLKLSDSERLDGKIVSEVLENINSMKKELLDVKEMIIKKNSGEFARKAQFLKQRFTE
ncbi:MAG: hypothetical protein COB38_04980 [Gammaproteobacteria bacterium]|nr:MAG: hypothetical protein COB38_04980 [Gammaproteobacteria bacterium]